MEVSLLTPPGIRLKGKQVTILVSPPLNSKKTPTDAVVFFSRTPESFDTALLEGNKIIIDGAGEYEVGGVKIGSDGLNGDLYHEVGMDGIDILVAKASSLSKKKEAAKEYQVAVIDADSQIEQSFIAALNLNALVLYGEKAKETAVKLGQENISPVTKYSVTREKLPTETQIVILQ